MRKCEHCGRNISDAEQRAQIRKLADGTRTVREIAMAVGVNYGVVYQQIHKEELAAKRDEKRLRNWDRFIFVAKEKRAGKTLREIGDDLGISKERVRQMVREVERVERKGRRNQGGLL